jgi:hypothetical protein
MSYEDTNCPCGDKKLPDTMLCQTCQTAFAERREMKIFKSDSIPEIRRHAAIILIELSKKRKQGGKVI